MPIVALRIKNLPMEATDYEIRELFEPIPSRVVGHMPGRGMAVVTIAEEDESAALDKLKGAAIFGTLISVEKAGK